MVALLIVVVDTVIGVQLLVDIWGLYFFFIAVHCCWLVLGGCGSIIYCDELITVVGGDAFCLLFMLVPLLLVYCWLIFGARK